LDDKGVKAWERKGYDHASLTTVNTSIVPNHLFDYLVGFKNENKYKGYFSIISLTVKRDLLLEAGILFHERLKLHQDSFFIFQLSKFLNLYSGEISKPVALRGVHSKNRYIHAPNLKRSQSLVFLALRGWAISIGLDKFYINYFNEIYLTKQLRSIRKKYRLGIFMKLFFSDKVVRELMTKVLLKRLLKLFI
jgi:hypothetical protein